MEQKQLEDSYPNRNLSLGEYRHLYVSRTSNDNEINVRQSYNRYKSKTIPKPALLRPGLNPTLPRDVSNIILSQTKKIKPYNRDSYYDITRLPEVEKKCDRPITLRELKDFSSLLLNGDKDVVSLLDNNTLIISPVDTQQDKKIFYTYTNSNTLISENTIVSNTLKAVSYTYKLLDIQSTEEIRLNTWIKELDKFGYKGSFVPLPFYRYFLAKRTLCFNLVDDDYVNNQLEKVVSLNINKLLKGITSSLFDLSYKQLLTLDYDEYNISLEYVQDKLEHYNKNTSIFNYLSGIMNNFSDIILFFYTIGIFDIDDQDDRKIGIIRNINNLSGDLGELLYLTNLHLYCIVFGLRTAIDNNLYTSDTIGSGLVSISSLINDFDEYIAT